MPFRIENDIEFYATIPGGGSGNLSVGNAVSPNRRIPQDVMNNADTTILKIEESGKHETSLCTILSATTIVRDRVIDYLGRSGPETDTIDVISYSKISFSAGQLLCAGTIPQPMNVFLTSSGTFSYGAAVRATIFFSSIAEIQNANSNIQDGEVVVAVYGVAPGDGLGGVFAYDASGNAGTIDSIDIWDPGTPGSPRAGILARQRLDIQEAFFNGNLSIYGDATNVSRSKMYRAARASAGVNEWMGQKVSAGNDGKNYTDLELIARDRQAAEVAMIRARSYGDSDDQLHFLKPFTLPDVATKAGIPAGAIARVTADERLYLNDALRGLSEILLSDGGARARVANRAGLRALTPDGYIDNEFVIVDGANFRGDGDTFLAFWSSGSSAADNDYDVFKPTLHADGSPWVEPGRFLALTPISGSTLPDGAASPDLSGGVIFNMPATPPAGGYDFSVAASVKWRDNKTITFAPGLAPATINYVPGLVETPDRQPFVLETRANGGVPIVLYKRNGVINFRGAGGSGGSSLEKSSNQVTQATLADASSAINTSQKALGKMVLETTNKRIYFAMGPGATDAWRPFDDQSFRSDVTPS